MPKYRETLVARLQAARDAYLNSQDMGYATGYNPATLKYWAETDPSLNLPLPIKIPGTGNRNWWPIRSVARFARTRYTPDNDKMIDRLRKVVEHDV